MAGAAMVEYQRFTIESVNAGRADGWAFASGWYPYQLSVWAWFRRDVVDG